VTMGSLLVLRQVPVAGLETMGTALSD